MGKQFYTAFSSPFNTFSIIWEKSVPHLQVKQIFLSDPDMSSELKALKAFPQISKGSSDYIILLGKKIQRYFKGEVIEFELDRLDFSCCSNTQKKVLFAEYEIPRGWVSTYKRIAIHVGIPRGARVVGNSLARNPFPIVIPCHRAIKSNGELGGYQGGISMKRTLLELEGLKITKRGKVLTNNIFY